MNVFDNLILTYKRGNILTKLIYINSALFLLFNALLILLKLFKVDGLIYMDYLSIPSNLANLAHRAWTPITYMFFHQNLFHILFNMLALYWFGKIFLMYYSEKQLLSLYVFGGLLGAVFFVFIFNLIPYFNTPNETGIILSQTTSVLGASGAIIAIVVASAIKAPNIEMKLFFVGQIKLVYIALFVIGVSFFGITGNNSGGEVVHLGGALAGYLFVVLEKRGKDFTPFFNKIIDFFVNLFRRRETKFKANTTYHSAKMSDGDYNRKKVENEQEINHILDKIKTSGYESLTAAEKKKLFEQKR